MNTQVKGKWLLYIHHHELKENYFPYLFQPIWMCTNRHHNLEKKNKNKK